MLLLMVSAITLIPKPARAQNKGTDTAPDTLRLTLQQAEQLFLENNYLLLAQKFNINTSEAAVEQAKLWSNPVFSFESVAYNPHTKKAFDYSNNTPQTGQYILQIQQMVSLAAQRSKLVRMAETNTALQRLAFDDLMRTLRRQLHAAFFDLASEQRKVALYTTESLRLGQLMEAQRTALRSGAISGYELTRLEVEQQSLNMEIAARTQTILSLSADFKLLTAIPAGTVPVPLTPEPKATLLPLANIAMDSAIANRPDIKAAKTQVLYQNRNLSYQRSLAVPNLTLGAVYDKFGSAFNNYTGVSASFDIPFLNRNQGNIQAAGIGIKAAEAGSLYAEQEVRNQVFAALQQLQLARNQYLGISPELRASLNQISAAAISDYNKRIISLIDFIDKIRTARTARLNEADMRNNYLQAIDNFESVTNTAFFRK